MGVADARLRVGHPRLFAVTEAVVVQVLRVDRPRQPGGSDKRPLSLPGLRFPGKTELRSPVAEVAGIPHYRVGVDCREQRRNDIPSLSGQNRDLVIPIHLEIPVPDADDLTRLRAAILKIEFELARKFAVPQRGDARTGIIYAEAREARVHREIAGPRLPDPRIRRCNE